MEKVKYTYTEVPIPAELRSDPRLSHLSDAALSILIKRGYSTGDEIFRYLLTDGSDVIRNYRMNGTDEAVSLITNAIHAHRKIIVYRDYDCDGCCAGAIVVGVLRRYGADIDHYANDRAADGYGMCVNGVKRILEKWPDTAMILTVDNGISSYEGIDYAKSLGLTVIVTDHHEPGDSLPRADAVIDPKQKNEIYPFRNLCGAGVALKLMLAFCRANQLDINPVTDMIDLAALATVADIVPLVGENRAIVRAGLPLINSGRRPFFAALMSQAHLSDLNAKYGLGFRIGPMVNAISRMGLDTNMVVDMMISEEPPENLSDQADLMIQTNEERKRLTREFYEVVLEQSLEQKDETCVIVRNDDIPDGIAGILAGKLKEEYNRVCIVLSAHGGAVKGSARGAGGASLKDLLDEVPDGILLGYGGHEKAAGMSMKEENYEKFVEEFRKITDRVYAGQDFTPRKEIDAVLGEDDCSFELMEELKALEPFGEGFPEPLFGLRARPARSVRMGQENQHVKYTTEHGLQIIRWNCADEGTRMPEKFVGSPRVNEWMGEKRMQFICE